MLSSIYGGGAMKSRLIAILMIFIFIISTIPAFAETDKLLENAIKNAKAKIDIPDNYTKFNSNIEMTRNSQIFHLYWTGENTNEKSGGNISANVDEKGRIIYYSHYEYGAFNGDYKLSVIDYNSAENIARQYISKICPELANHVKPSSKKNYIARNSGSYNILFYRYENGVPYYNNYIVVSIGANNSTVKELQVAWDDFQKFSIPNNAISALDAEKMFKEKIGVKLGYTRYYDDATGNTKILQYSTNINGNNYISAYTGEVIDAKLPNGNKFLVNMNSYKAPDVEAPLTKPVDSVVSATSAYNELITRVGLELQYIAKAKKNVVSPENAKDVDIMLVYSFKPNKPLFVDAKTGKLTSEYGKPYEDDIPIQFTDIEGHPSQKHINTLAACGVIKQEGLYRPEESITQRDYLKLALIAMEKYKTTDIYDVYESLLAEKIITINERDENAEITKEQAIKYLVRLLGYTDIAELEDTYKTDFVDEGMIDSKLIGYAAIAKGLKIIRGNAFAPKQIVTRATAAEIFYNLLSSN